MILCFKLDNTEIYGGIFNKNKLIVQFKHSVYQGITSEQLSLFLKQTLLKNKINVKKIKDIAYCSVTPYLNIPLRKACIALFNKDPFSLQAGPKNILKKNHPHHEIGIHIIANSIAALARFPNQNLILVDFGATTTTICAINKQKEYLGSSVLPGVLLSMDGLQQQTTLPPIFITKPTNVIGHSNIESIQSGLFYSQLGAVHSIIRAIQLEIFTNKKIIIIATGGFVHWFDYENLFTTVIPELSLVGLQLALINNKCTKKASPDISL